MLVFGSQNVIFYGLFLVSQESFPCWKTQQNPAQNTIENVMI